MEWSEKEEESGYFLSAGRVGSMEEFSRRTMIQIWLASSGIKDSLSLEVSIVIVPDSFVLAAMAGVGGMGGDLGRVYPLAVADRL